MDPNYLDFEQPLAKLAKKIEELRLASNAQDINIAEQIKEIQSSLECKTKEIFADLSDWQVSQLARHPLRPYTLDYIKTIFTDFEELHGDRAFADDPAIVGGIARLKGKPMMVIGQQKGRDVKDRQYRNFGMPRPEGYRKALRLMQLAERFHLPVLTLIDTAGAYPGVGAEERGQSEAIARNLFVMAGLKTPILCTIIGEGGSGGALAIGVGDHVMMFEYSTYSVISPEGCAAILWKSPDKAAEAAKALGLTAGRLKQLGLIDEIIAEPLGGAHRNPEASANHLQNALLKALEQLQALPLPELLERRYQRLMSYGRYQTLENGATASA